VPQIIQRSFTSGEIAPSLQSRADITKYSNGLNLCENFFIRAQGGIYSRPGFRFIGELDDSSKVGRLIPFSFNTEQTYVLVFEHLKMRVIKDGGYVLAGAGPAIFELTTPYTEDQLSRLSYTQSADVMTIAHPDHDPKNLNRLAHDNWTLTTVDYSAWLGGITAPGSNFKNITAITQANPAVVTTSIAHTLVDGNTVEIGNIFVSMTQINGEIAKVNVLSSTTFELVGVDSSAYTAYSSGSDTGVMFCQKSINTIGFGEGSFEKYYAYSITAVDFDGVESLHSYPVYAYLNITAGSLSTTAGIRLNWTGGGLTDYYRVYKETSFESGVYGWIGDTESTLFDDYNIAPITSDAPPRDRQPFSGADNKPAVVNYYQQRQIFANTNNEPQTTFTTQTANYNSLRTSNPARDDDAITFTIAAQQVNEIRHIVSLDSLILLTSGGEWLVSEGQDQVITPATIGVRIQSYNGSSWVKPVIINSTVLYLQEKNARIRDLGYEFSSDKYTGNDLSIMSEHLFEDHQIIDMAYANEPYGILWCVRDDGVLLGLTYQREHQVWGWHHHTTDGEFESVTTISEDGRDALYAIVKRTIDGQTKRYVERLEKRESKIVEDAFCVDSGLSYNGVPVTVISGLDHLEGEEVAVLADGNEVTGLTVSSGSITLTREASKIHVGLPYLPVAELLDIDTPSPQQTVKAQSVSVSKVFIEFEGSRGGFVGARQDPTSGQTITFQEIKPRFDLDGYDAIALRTFKQEVTIDPSWNKGGGVRIEQRSPLPMAILSVIPRVDIGGS